MAQRGENRDYIPTRERDLASKCADSASIQDGLSCRVTVDKRRPHYRKYTGKDAQPDPFATMLSGY